MKKMEWEHISSSVKYTLGSGEEQIVGAVDAEDGLAVSLGHVDALQQRARATLGGRHRMNDAPAESNKHVHLHAVKHRGWATTFTGRC